MQYFATIPTEFHQCQYPMHDLWDAKAKLQRQIHTCDPLRNVTEEHLRTQGGWLQALPYRISGGIYSIHL